MFARVSLHPYATRHPTYFSDAERFELTCYTTYSQYKYAVQSGRVDDLRLLPPKFPFVQVRFRFPFRSGSDFTHSRTNSTIIVLVGENGIR